MIEFIESALAQIVGWRAYGILYCVLLICGMGLPLPEDIPLFAAGLICYAGHADIRWMILTGLIGVMSGDSLMYHLGSKYGDRLVRAPVISWFLHPERFQRIQEMYQQHGPKVLFGGRFMPGLRSPVFFIAGMSKIPYRWLLIYDGAGALISVPSIIYLTYLFGDQLNEVKKYVKRTQHGILLIILAVVIYYVLHWWMKRGVSRLAGPKGSTTSNDAPIASSSETPDP